MQRLLVVFLALRGMGIGGIARQYTPCVCLHEFDRHLPPDLLGPSSPVAEVFTRGEHRRLYRIRFIAERPGRRRVDGEGGGRQREQSKVPLYVEVAG